jgi:hypothetical protein
MKPALNELLYFYVELFFDVDIPSPNNFLIM